MTKVTPVPRKLKKPEVAALVAELNRRTNYIRHALAGNDAAQVMKFVFANVGTWAGPDYDYACRWALITIDEFRGLRQVATTTLRGLAMMYGEPFKLPKELWWDEVKAARHDMLRSLQALYHLQEKYPWVKPAVKYSGGLYPTVKDLKVLKRRHPSGRSFWLARGVQHSANYNEASYWLHRYWYDELRSQYPRSYRPKTYRASNTLTDVHARDKIKLPREVAIQGQFSGGEHGSTRRSRPT